MMTPEEFKKKMQKCADDADQEGGHWQADKLMCEVLREMGYGEGVTIFMGMDKWYA